MTISFSTNLLIITNNSGTTEAIDMRLISVCQVDPNERQTVWITLTGSSSVSSVNARRLNVDEITSPSYATGQDLADAINTYRIALSSSGGSASLRADSGVAVVLGDNTIAYSSALSGTDWVISIVSDTGWSITSKDANGFIINMLGATTIDYISTPVQ